MSNNDTLIEIIKETLEKVSIESRLTTVTMHHQELQVALLRKGPDILLLDISFPLNKNFQTLDLIRTKAPAIPILVIGETRETLYIVEVLRRGAAGYINLDHLQTDLCLALEKIYDGSKYVYC